MISLRTIAPALLCLAAACASTQHDTHSSTTAAMPEGTWIGMQETAETRVRLADLDADPAAYYDQVLIVEADAHAVCEKKQCWMQMKDGDTWTTVRWDSGCGGQYKFPETAIGKHVYVQGEVYPMPEAQQQALLERGAALPAEPYIFRATAVMVDEG